MEMVKKTLKTCKDNLEQILIVKIESIGHSNTHFKTIHN